MPLIEDTATIRPPARSTSAVEQRVVDPLLAGEVDRRAPSPTASSSIRPSVLSRVMPALCTTMSTPPWRSRRWSASRAARPSAVMSSCSAVAADAVGHRRRARRPRRACRGSTTCAPSRASTSAIDAPMPRAAPVTSATLPSSGRSQSVGRVDCAGADADHLAAYTYADRDDSRKRSVDSMACLGAGRDVDELRGGAAAELLADRARRSPRARAARWRSRGALARARAGVPSTITRPLGPHLADRRVEEVVELRAAARCRRCRWRRRSSAPYAGPSPAAVARPPPRRRRASRATASEPAAGRRPSSAGPVEQRLPGLVAAQRASGSGRPSRLATKRPGAGLR